MLIGIIWEGRTEGGKDTEGERGERRREEERGHRRNNTRRSEREWNSAAKLTLGRNPESSGWDR